MKIRKYTSVVIFIFFVFFIVANCATENRIIKTLLTECCGTWLNKDYNKLESRAARIIYYPDGTWVAFHGEEVGCKVYRGTITITEKWKKRGCCWYKVTTNQFGLKTVVYELWKISQSGTILESVWKIGIHPTEINSKDPSYTIYYKQLNT